MRSLPAVPMDLKRQQHMHHWMPQYIVQGIVQLDRIVGWRWFVRVGTNPWMRGGWRINHYRFLKYEWINEPNRPAV